MKIYLASRYSDRDLLREHRTLLQSRGHIVTSSWLDTSWPIGEVRGQSSTAPPEYRGVWSVRDLADVKNSEMCVHFSCEQKGRGGRHVEFGYALAHCPYNVLIGPPEHLFHEHPAVTKFASWDSFYSRLREGW